MKKLFIACKATCSIFAAMFIIQGCVKDTGTRTYTIYAPVYKTPAEVRAGIKSDAPIAVKNPGKLFVLGNYIFLNEVDKGVHIIDNANPAAPVNKYFIAIPGNLDLAVKGNTLYADLYRDLVTIDISNPAAIAVKKISENVFPRRTYSNGFIGDTTKIIVDWIKKDTTVTTELDPSYYMWDEAVAFTNTTSQTTTAAQPVGISGSMARFTLLNNYLYTVSNTDLYAFDISQPDNPIHTNQMNIGWRIETIYPFKNNLFIGSQTGMFIYSVADPTQPALVSQFSHARVCDPVIAEDSFAYITLRTGTTCFGTVNQLDVLGITDINNPVPVVSYPLFNPHGLSKSGNMLFICDGEAGLKAFDATDKTNLQLLQSITGINAYDVIAANNIAIVVGKDGLYQYDYSNPNNITFKSRIGY